MKSTKAIQKKNKPKPSETENDHDIMSVSSEEFVPENIATTLSTANAIENQAPVQVNQSRSNGAYSYDFKVNMVNAYYEMVATLGPRKLSLTQFARNHSLPESTFRGWIQLVNANNHAIYKPNADATVAAAVPVSDPQGKHSSVDVIEDDGNNVVVEGSTSAGGREAAIADGDDGNSVSNNSGNGRSDLDNKRRKYKTEYTLDYKLKMLEKYFNLVREYRLSCNQFARDHNIPMSTFRDWITALGSRFDHVTTTLREVRDVNSTYVTTSTSGKSGAAYIAEHNDDSSLSSDDEQAASTGKKAADKSAAIPASATEAADTAAVAGVDVNGADNRPPFNYNIIRKNEYTPEYKLKLIKEYYYRAAIEGISSTRFAKEHRLPEATFRQWRKQLKESEKDSYQKIREDLQQFIALQKATEDGVSGSSEVLASEAAGNSSNEAAEGTASYDILKVKAKELAEKYLNTEELTRFKPTDWWIYTILKNEKVSSNPDEIDLEDIDFTNLEKPPSGHSGRSSDRKKVRTNISNSTEPRDAALRADADDADKEVVDDDAEGGAGGEDDVEWNYNSRMELKGKKIYTNEYKLKMVNQYFSLNEEKNVSSTKFAKDHNIPEATFRKWRREARSGILETNKTLQIIEDELIEYIKANQHQGSLEHMTRSIGSSSSSTANRAIGFTAIQKKAKELATEHLDPENIPKFKASTTWIYKLIRRCQNADGSAQAIVDDLAGDEDGEAPIEVIDSGTSDSDEEVLVEIATKKSKAASTVSNNKTSAAAGKRAVATTVSVNNPELTSTTVSVPASNGPVKMRHKQDYTRLLSKAAAIASSNSNAAAAAAASTGTDVALTDLSPALAASLSTISAATETSILASTTSGSRKGRGAKAAADAAESAEPAVGSKRAQGTAAAAEAASVDTKKRRK
jgi:transposase-like protein